MPAGVHLAVVDPGVGGERRASRCATRTGGSTSGPDNGLLLLAADELGDRAAPTSSTNARYRLRASRARSTPATSSRRPLRTSPPASRSASSGLRSTRTTLVRIDLPEPEVGQAQISATVLVGRPLREHRAERDARAHRRRSASAAGDRVELRLALDRYYAVVAEHVRRRRAGRADPLRGLLRARHARDQSAATRRGLTGAAGGDELRIAVA